MYRIFAAIKFIGCYYTKLILLWLQM